MKTKYLILILAFTFQVWLAHGQSICDSFTVDVETSTGTLLFCPEPGKQQILRAVAGYETDTIAFDPATMTFTWHIDQQEYHGDQYAFVIEEPGALPFVLTVFDPVNTCTFTFVETIKVGTVPSFYDTRISEDVVCAKDFFTLIGVVRHTTWTGFPTEVIETQPIPRNAEGYYESSLEFTVFPDDEVIDTMFDIDRVCLIIDHVAEGEVMFELECPNGTTIVLKDFGAGEANLGEPVFYDTITPGRGYEYCFSSAPLFGTMAVTTPEFHDYTDNAGNYYASAAHMPAGSYTPDQPFADLRGCPLNGKWTLRVYDQSVEHNGFMHGWRLFFDDTFYPDSLMFTPGTDTQQWYMENTRISGNPATHSISDSGEAFLRFEVVDNFGCAYDTTLKVTVLPLPKAEIVSDLDMPVCEEDSTFLRVFPVSGSQFDWVYQWMIGENELPDRIFDTIMAKDPAIYTVMITDTITGCQDRFPFEFADQNCDLGIPNVFTPNGDGINDLFEMENLEHYPRTQIVIYNRWGKKVFEHSDYYNNWWDGHGHPDGVYFYVIKYERMGKVRYAEGAVTIIR